jgi:hypothetical protein
LNDRNILPAAAFPDGAWDAIESATSHFPPPPPIGFGCLNTSAGSLGWVR